MSKGLIAGFGTLASKCQQVPCRCVSGVAHDDEVKKASQRRHLRKCGHVADTIPSPHVVSYASWAIQRKKKGGGGFQKPSQRFRAHSAAALQVH